MDAALKRDPLAAAARRACDGAWAAIGGVALAILAAGFIASNLMPLQADVTALRDRVQRLEMRAAIRRGTSRRDAPMPASSPSTNSACGGTSAGSLAPAALPRA